MYRKRFSCPLIFFSKQQLRRYLTTSSKIPVVDMGKIRVDNTEVPFQSEWNRVGGEIAQAFSDIGFVYLRNHGIPAHMVASINKSSDEFFKMPEVTKLKYQRGITHIQGYTAINRERLTISMDCHELRESYDIQQLHEMFPDKEVPQFRASVSPFMVACCALANRLLIAMAIGLGLEKNFFMSRHKKMFTEDNSTSLRILKYPPVFQKKGEEDVTRCGAHTDYGTMTVLFQDNMGGLEVRDREGEWVSAAPIPGTVLINVGDILQFWTSDKFRATEHRVLIPQDQLRETPRRSIAFFVHPDTNVVIEPLDGSQTYSPITAKEHSEKRFRETYQY